MTDSKKLWTAARRLAVLCDDPPPVTPEGLETVIKILAEYAPPRHVSRPDAVVAPHQVWRLSFKFRLAAKRLLH